MWLLNLTVYAVICLGWGVCLYALAVGVNDLYRKIKDKKKTVNEIEREYYADIFSQILHEYDQEDYPESLEKILGTLKTYVDGVHQIKPASKLKAAHRGDKLAEQIDANLNDGIEDENLALYLLEEASSHIKKQRRLLGDAESVIRALTSWGETFREVINSSHSDSSEEYRYKIGHLSVDMEDLLEDFIWWVKDINERG